MQSELVDPPASIVVAERDLPPDTSLLLILTNKSWLKCCCESRFDQGQPKGQGWGGGHSPTLLWSTVNSSWLETQPVILRWQPGHRNHESYQVGRRHHCFLLSRSTILLKWQASTVAAAVLCCRQADTGPESTAHVCLQILIGHFSVTCVCVVWRHAQAPVTLCVY